MRVKCIQRLRLATSCSSFALSEEFTVGLAVVATKLLLQLDVTDNVSPSCCVRNRTSGERPARGGSTPCTSGLYPNDANATCICPAKGVSFAQISDPEEGTTWRRRHPHQHLKP